MNVWADWKGISTQENEELDGEGEKGVVVKGKDVAFEQGSLLYSRCQICMNCVCCVYLSFQLSFLRGSVSFTNLSFIFLRGLFHLLLWHCFWWHLAWSSKRNTWRVLRMCQHFLTLLYVLSSMCHFPLTPPFSLSPRALLPWPVLLNVTVLIIIYEHVHATTVLVCCGHLCPVRCPPPCAILPRLCRGGIQECKEAPTQTEHRLCSDFSNAQTHT